MIKKKNKKYNKNRIDLDGKTWLKYSISVWNDIKKTKEEIRLSHPAMFPSHLADRLISIFSRKGDLVIDPFVGSGSSLIASRNSGRRSLGIDIYPKYIELTKKRLNSITLFGGPEPKAILDDAINILNHVEPETASLCITSPPYWDIHSQKRTADQKIIREYGKQKKDLSRIKNYNDFLTGLKEIFEKVYIALKIDGYCCIILMDIRKGKKYYPFHINTINFMNEIGFVLDDIIIWDRRLEYSNLRPLGYPYVFRVNKIHEYILIFQKRKGE